MAGRERTRHGRNIEDWASACSRQPVPDDWPKSIDGNAESVDAGRRIQVYPSMAGHQALGVVEHRLLDTARTIGMRHGSSCGVAEQHRTHAPDGCSGRLDFLSARDGSLLHSRRSIRSPHAGCPGAPTRRSTGQSPNFCANGMGQFSGRKRIPASVIASGTKAPTDDGNPLPS